MRWGATLVMLGASVVLADDPLGDTRALDEQIKALDASPVAVKIKEISSKIDENETEKQRETAKLYDEIQKLQESDAYKEYEQRRQELASKRESEWEVERRKMAEAARALYAARHDELKSRKANSVTALGALGFDVLTYPRVDGSTSTQPLAVIVASHALDVPYEWLYPEPRGYAHTRAPYPRLLFGALEAGSPSDTEERTELALAASRVVAKPADKDRGQLRKAIMINSMLATNTGTHESYENLINGDSDLILVARAPSQDEQTLAKEKGVQIKTRPVALDAMVFIVHRDSAVKNLSLDEIRRLYRDAMKDTTRPSDLPIRPLMRERNSGSRELFDALVMKGESLPEPKRPRVFEFYTSGMGGPFSRVTTDAKALGYSVYYYERFMAMSPYTRTISIDGIEPTPESLASGEYPLTTPLYAAWRADQPADAPGPKLLHWLVSDEGQSVIRESGYVPLR